MSAPPPPIIHEYGTLPDAGAFLTCCSQVLFINNLQFITLGHGIVSDPVLAHAFFGTQAVVRAVAGRESVAGVVVIPNGFRRWFE
jgi:formylmethanofuran dehydrogenase subunit D